MKQKKLNLKALEASLPSLNSTDAKTILGGNSYGEPIELDEVVIIGNPGNTHDDYDPDQGDYEYSDPDYQDYQAGSPDNSQSQNSWALEHPIAAVQAYQNSNAAFDATNSLPGQHNGFADAARHAYWMAMNAADFGGSLATELGIAHEQESANQAETNMDLNNNAWGIEFAETWGSSDFSFADFMDFFWDAVQSGEIVIIDQSTIPDENLWGN